MSNHIPFTSVTEATPQLDLTILTYWKAARIVEAYWRTSDPKRHLKTDAFTKKLAYFESAKDAVAHYNKNLAAVFKLIIDYAECAKETEPVTDEFGNLEPYKNGTRLQRERTLSGRLNSDESETIKATLSEAAATIDRAKRSPLGKHVTYLKQALKIAYCANSNAQMNDWWGICEKNPPHMDTRLGDNPYFR